MEMCRCDTFTTFQLAMNIFFRVSRICEILFPFLSGSITIVSYGTAFWYVEEESGSHVGLWQKCVGNPLRCVGITLEYSGTNGHLRATQVFLSFALIVAIFGSFVSILSAITRKWQLLVLSAISLSVQTTLLLIGLSIYSNILTTLQVIRYDVTISAGWSFYISWFGLFIALSGAIYFAAVTIYRYKTRTLLGSANQDTQPFIRQTQLLHLYSDEDSD